MSTISERPGPKGRTVYQARVRVPGHPQKTRTFDRKTEAKRWANEVETELLSMAHQPTEASARTPLSHILRRYREEVSPSHKGADAEQHRLQAWERAHPLRDTALDKISSVDIVNWRNQRQKEVSADTVVRELGLLHSVIEHARCEWGYHLRENPASGVRRPKTSGSRERRLQPLEEEYLLKAMDRGNSQSTSAGGSIHPIRQSWLQPAFLFSLETALRRGELLKLRWEDIDLGKRVAHIRDTKNGKSRVIPLSSKALEILHSLQNSDDGRVFSTTETALRQAWDRSRKRAKQLYLADCESNHETPDHGFLDNLRWHDLRHEATSRLFEMGMNQIEVATVTGHQDLRMLQSYTHLRAEDLAQRFD